MNTLVKRKLAKLENLTANYITPAQAAALFAGIQEAIEKAVSPTDPDAGEKVQREVECIVRHLHEHTLSAHTLGAPCRDHIPGRAVAVRRLVTAEAFVASLQLVARDGTGNS